MTTQYKYTYPYKDMDIFLGNFNDVDIWKLNDHTISLVPFHDVWYGGDILCEDESCIECKDWEDKKSSVTYDCRISDSTGKYYKKCQDALLQYLESLYDPSISPNSK